MGTMTIKKRANMSISQTKVLRRGRRCNILLLVALGASTGDATIFILESIYPHYTRKPTVFNTASNTKPALTLSRARRARQSPVNAANIGEMQYNFTVELNIALILAMAAD